MRCPWPTPEACAHRGTGKTAGDGVSLQLPWQPLSHYLECISEENFDGRIQQRHGNQTTVWRVTDTQHLLVHLQSLHMTH